MEQDQIVGGDQRHRVSLAALLPVLVDDAQAAPVGLGLGLGQHDHPGADARSLAREFLDDDTPLKQTLGRLPVDLGEVYRCPVDVP